MADEHATARTSGIWVIATAAGIWLLYQGQELLVPIAFALVLSAICRPLVRGLQRLYVPPIAGAGIVVLGLIGALAIVVLLLSGPVETFMSGVPASMDRAQVRLQSIRAKLQRASDAAAKLQHVVDGPTTVPATGPANDSSNASTTHSSTGRTPGTPQHEPAVPSAPGPSSNILVPLFGTTAKVISGLMEVLLITFLLLSTGNLFFKKLLRMVPEAHDKRTAHQIVEESQSVVTRFVVLITIINVVQGTVIGLALWMLGVPNPVLWGMFSAVMEFVPYLGAVVMMIALSVVSFATFDSMTHILAVPGVYFLISTIQNSLIAPHAYGSRLKLNPVAVLLGVLFWWFVWGVAGAFLAIPIIAMIKLIADETDSLIVLRELLGE